MIMFDYLQINNFYYGWEKLYNERTAGVRKAL